MQLNGRLPGIGKILRQVLGSFPFFHEGMNCSGDSRPLKKDRTIGALFLLKVSRS